MILSLLLWQQAFRLYSDAEECCQSPLRYFPSEIKIDVRAGGRNRRSAGRGIGILADETWAGSPCHENASIRNASGRCVSSRTGVPTRSFPTSAANRASVS